MLAHDYAWTDIACLNLDTLGNCSFFPFNERMVSVSWTAPHARTCARDTCDRAEERSACRSESVVVVYSFAVDLEKGELTVARDGVPALQPLLTGRQDLHEMTIVAGLSEHYGTGSYIVLESEDE